LLAYVCWRAFEEEAGAGGEGVLEEEGSWGGSLAPRNIRAGVGDVADLRESEERLELERVGIRVGGADSCCCRDDSWGIMLDGTDVGVELRASPASGVGVHGSGLGVGLSSTSGI